MRAPTESLSVDEQTQPMYSKATMEAMRRKAVERIQGLEDQLKDERSKVNDREQHITKLVELLKEARAVVRLKHAELYQVHDELVEMYGKLVQKHAETETLEKAITMKDAAFEELHGAFDHMLAQQVIIDDAEQDRQARQDLQDQQDQQQASGAAKFDMTG